MPRHVISTLAAFIGVVALFFTTAHADSPVHAVMVKDVNPDQVSWSANYNTLKYLANVNGTVFFDADDGVHGTELWKSDGTASGTVMVADISPTGTSSPMYLTNFNGSLIFVAYEPLHGWELWKSNGTQAGTVMVKDINPGAAGGAGAWLTVVGGNVFFTADDGIHGVELWKSDGTEPGTVMVNAPEYNLNPKYLTNVNGTLFFISGVDGSLWKSDGTSTGTVFLKAIGVNLSGPGPYMAGMNGTLYFQGTDLVNGSELWKSDGTSDGTVIVKDINPSGHSAPQYMTNVSGTLFFNAKDETHGFELWKSDGTANGTVMVKDIYSGNDPLPGPESLVNVNGTLYFETTDDTYSIGLWKSDGTLPGTVKLKTVNPAYLGNGGGMALFGGPALWESDGSEAGTMQVQNVTPWLPLQTFTNVNGIVFFAGNDETHGIELWKTVAGLPVISLSASAWSAGRGQAVTLTSTLANSHWRPITALGYTHTLPAHLSIATVPNVSNTCGGSVIANAGGSAITLTGGKLGMDATCTIRVDVVADALGDYSTTTGVPSALETGPGSASNSITLQITDNTNLYLPGLYR